MMEEEVTQEELERCYHLGKAGGLCCLYVNNADNIQIKGEDIDRLFEDFRKKAQAYNIVLPEKLPDESSERWKTFHDHFFDLKEHFQGKNKHLKIAFNSGILLEGLRISLNMCILVTDNDTKRLFRIQVNENACELQGMAEEKGVNIDKELRTIVKSETELQERIDINKILFDLKREFCSLPPNEAIISTKRSEVDPTRTISNKCWVVSLVRLPDKGHDEHAFLVLEAKTGTTSKIWFIDFVNQETDLLLPGIRDGKVRIWTFPEEGTAGSSNKLLFKCQKPMMDVQPGDRLLYTSWPIPKRTAEILLQNVNAQQENPPKYNILGNTMLAGFTGAAKSKGIGHNCFTFARKMLLDLKDPYIELPAGKLEDWGFSATSRFLVDPQLERLKRQMSRFPMLFAFLVGLGVSYIIFKLLS